MLRSEKESQVKTFAEALTKSVVALCLDYRGLSVAEITELRREVKKSGASMKVVKNTLFKLSVAKALESASSAEREKFAALFAGPSLVIYSTVDPVAPAKALVKFAKDKEKISIKGGWIDGNCIVADGVKQLSAMPGKSEMQAMLLALLQTPATQLVRVLQASGEGMVRALEAHRKNLEAKAA